MMFNGLLVCGDSDTSDFAKESIGDLSGVSNSFSDQLSTADCLRSKLVATMQILENKEETIRVQAQSLALAESRIVALTERAELYRRQLAQLQPARSPGPQLVDKSDISINTDIYQGLGQKKIVTTLQDNLSVIEELYRECFYETAKQEELIDLLRKSCSDIRVMDKNKAEQIGRLQNVVNSQKWSLNRYQDIAIEVDSLKSEISNFLNSSNYDSGVWEREEALPGELAADLQQVGAQLLRLRDLLANDCVCGLKDENVKLRQRNGQLETQGEELRERVRQLEAALQDKDEQCMQRLELKEAELVRVSQQLEAVQQGRDQRAASCDALTHQLQHLQTLLSNKSEELVQLQGQYEVREGTVNELQKQLDKAQLVIEQERGVREEVRQLSRAVGAWRAQLAACQRRMRGLQHDLQHAHDYCHRVTQQIREKENSASQLKGELEEAHRRGAQLCGDTRRLVGGLRAWLQRHRERVSEQEEKIKEQQETIRKVQRRASDEPCCSRYITPEETVQKDSRSEVADCIKCVALRRTSSNSRVSEIGSCCKCDPPARETIGSGGRTSDSERTSCTSPPKPPRRFFKKKNSPSTSDWGWRHCDAAVQRPVRSDAVTSTGTEASGAPARAPCDCECERGGSGSGSGSPPRTRGPSSAEELLERVEGARYALHAAHTRWHRPHAHTVRRQ